MKKRLKTSQHSTLTENILNKLLLLLISAVFLIPACFQHVAICPYFAKTAILNGLPDVDKMVKALPFGMTTVERVGDAFQQIVMDQR